MVAVKIILGLIGLGIVVFVHELGHFLGARLCGINVDAFSIGWGRPILKKKIRGVEYRLGMFPLGGYCKMQGDNDYREVYENIQKGISPPAGSFFAASPARRIVVAFAGPLFNLIFAIIALSVIWGSGFQIKTMGNRIVLASEIFPDEHFPADAAGLLTGDRIIQIDDKPISWYHEIQETIAFNPEKPLSVTVDRNGELISLNITPLLDKSSATGRIGVISWVEPVLESVTENSPAARAGLEGGDRIIAVNDQEIRQTLDLAALLKTGPDAVSVDYTRNGELLRTRLEPEYTEAGEAVLGIQWALMQYKSPALTVPAAMAKGTKEAWNTLSLTLRSFRLLFKGIDLTQAVSGPVRITYMMGDIAAEGFGQSVGVGLRSMANFLALISIALCIMNLLPLPILDGGMIVLCLIEIIRRRPLNPRAASVFQTLGIVLIGGLMIFALFGDILYLVKK